MCELGYSVRIANDFCRFAIRDFMDLDDGRKVQILLLFFVSDKCVRDEKQ